jgi:hypothetical protein
MKAVGLHNFHTISFKIETTGHEGLQVYEMSRSLHCSDNQFAGVDGVMRLSTDRSLFPRNVLYFSLWYSYMLEAE